MSASASSMDKARPRVDPLSIAVHSSLNIKGSFWKINQIIIYLPDLLFKVFETS